MTKRERKSACLCQIERVIEGARNSSFFILLLFPFLILIYFYFFGGGRGALLLCNYRDRQKKSAALSQLQKKVGVINHCHQAALSKIWCLLITNIIHTSQIRQGPIVPRPYCGGGARRGKETGGVKNQPERERGQTQKFVCATPETYFVELHTVTVLGLLQSEGVSTYFSTRSSTSPQALFSLFSVISTSFSALTINTNNSRQANIHRKALTPISTKK